MRAALDHLGRHTIGNHVCRQVARDDSPCADDCPFTNAPAFQHDCANAYPTLVTHPDRTSKVNARRQVDCVSEHAIVVDGGARVDDCAFADTSIGIQDCTGHNYGTVTDPNIGSDRRARMNRAPENESIRYNVRGNSFARGIVAKCENDVMNPLRHKLTHLLPAAQHRRIAKALSVPLRMNVVKKSDEFMVRTYADDVRNHPSMSAGAQNH